MKCVACGYEYVACAKEEWRVNSAHDGAYTVGPDPFSEFKTPAVLQTSRLYVCPKRGTVRAE